MARLRSKAFLSLVAAAGLALPAAVRAAPSPDEDPPGCAECHEEEAAQWKASSHARAMKPEFLAEWERQGKKWECLVCHTSVYDRGAGTFSKEGVGCESCHGAAKPGHPGTAKMAAPVTSESCRDCHSLTYAEWRVSAHGQKDIGCIKCHAMHEMKLRKDDPDQQCGSCHTERLRDFAHATHHRKGLQCISCHMPKDPAARSHIKGTGVRGHSYGVGAETCAGCHRIQVHQSAGMSDLEKEVETLRDAGADATLRRVETLNSENAVMADALEGNQRAFPWALGLSFVLGIGLGVGFTRLSRNPAPAEAPTPAAVAARSARSARP